MSTFTSWWNNSPYIIHSNKYIFIWYLPCVCHYANHWGYKVSFLRLTKKIPGIARSRDDYGLAQGYRANEWKVPVFFSIRVNALSTAWYLKISGTVESITQETNIYWCLGPTLRHSNFIYLGYALGSRFLEVPPCESNMDQSRCLEHFVNHACPVLCSVVSLLVCTRMNLVSSVKPDTQLYLLQCLWPRRLSTMLSAP